jgi:hypothetical protein
MHPLLERVVVAVAIVLALSIAALGAHFALITRDFHWLNGPVL